MTALEAFYAIIRASYTPAELVAVHKWTAAMDAAQARVRH